LECAGSPIIACNMLACAAEVTHVLSGNLATTCGLPGRLVAAMDVGQAAAVTGAASNRPLYSS
jgi:hypothetical protein